MNRDELSDLLMRLSNVRAASGEEKAMRRELRALLEGHGEMTVDAMGSLIVRAPVEGEARLRVMVDAHMDEVSLMVVGHASGGELIVGGVGGFDPRIFPGLRVLVGEEALPGVIGLKPIHLAEDDEFERAVKMRQLRVDIGAKDKKDAQKLAPLGTRIHFPTQAERVGELLAGKAFDDRGGCTLLTALLLDAPWPVALLGLFSAQEEVGARGARVAAQRLQPDVAFVLESTVADDLPREEEGSATTIVGRGPAVSVLDRRAATPPALLHFVLHLAEAEGIPVQLKRPMVSGTDASVIHRAGVGVPTLTLSLPARYIHGPVAMIDPRDLESAYRLMAAVLRHITPDVIQP